VAATRELAHMVCNVWLVAGKLNSADIPVRKTWSEVVIGFPLVARVASRLDVFFLRLHRMSW